MRPNCMANPKKKNTVATEIGGSFESAPRRFATSRTMKKSAIEPSAESTYELGWSVGLPKKKPRVCSRLLGVPGGPRPSTYDSENGFVKPGLLWSCQADARMSKIRLWSAQWISSSGARMTGQDMVALPSRLHTHRMMPTTGNRKIADS